MLQVELAENVFLPPQRPRDPRAMGASAPKETPLLKGSGGGRPYSVLVVRGQGMSVSAAPVSPTSLGGYRYRSRSKVMVGSDVVT